MSGEEEENLLQGVKCMIVGDSETGKTSLFCRMMRRDLPLEYEPTVFDVTNKEIEYNGSKVNVTMWDSAGSHLFDTIRPISYAHTDCFLICFATNNSTSLRNVVQRWYPEILRHGDGPTVPIILVATKTDLQTNIRSLEVEEVQKEINAHFLFQFSSKIVDVEAEDRILDRAVELAWTKKIDETKPNDPIWKFHNLTLIVLGDSGVGKTSFIHKCIIQRDANSVGRKKQEEGSYEEYYHDVVIDDSEYFLRLLEVQLDGSSLPDMKKADALILCYAVNDPFSFQSINNLLCQKELENVRRNQPIFLIGTKCDLQEISNIVIPFDDGYDLKQRMNLSYFLECSAKAESHIDLVREFVQICRKENKASK